MDSILGTKKCGQKTVDSILGKKKLRTKTVHSILGTNIADKNSGFNSWYKHCGKQVY